MQPLDFVVKPLSNPRVDRWLSDLRRRAGVGQIPLGAGVRAVYRSLRQNRWVALVGDQDAHAAGVFVPFFGRPTSTPRGPADLALRTGAPLIMGFATRMPDGRHRLEMEPPLAVPERHDEAAVEDLTARHTARLEAWIRRRPDHWLWLHRRWKTAPRSAGAHTAGPLAAASGGR
jgi:KDO2-lipid IV(A) lauroyltransferase